MGHHVRQFVSENDIQGGLPEHALAGPSDWQFKLT